MWSNTVCKLLKGTSGSVIVGPHDQPPTHVLADLELRDCRRLRRLLIRRVHDAEHTAAQNPRRRRHNYLASRAESRHFCGMPKPLRRCENRHCRRALPPTARADARFCSGACRAKERRHRPRMNRLHSRSSFFGGVDRHCQQCGKYMVLGLDDRREDARYCSPRCRQRAYVARKRARSARSSLPESFTSSRRGLGGGQICPANRRAAAQ